MSLISDSLHRAIDAHLTSGGEKDARAIAERLVHMLTRLSTPATQLIGQAGFRALVTRSLHVNKRAYPWLSPQASGDTEGLYAGLQDCLSRRDPEAATDAAVGLLTVLTNLLSAFIGDHLTAALLKQAWLDVSDVSPRESPHE